MNEVPLNGQDQEGSVNYFAYRIVYSNPDGTEKNHYKGTWVTDLKVSRENIEQLVKGARCRWKIENECFNTLKNQRYHMDHNFGHGTKNLSYNFYLLILTAFFFHQILECDDEIFKECRKKFGSRKNLWHHLRATIYTLVFDN